MALVSVWFAQPWWLLTFNISNIMIMSEFSSICSKEDTVATSINKDKSLPAHKKIFPSTSLNEKQIELIYCGIQKQKCIDIKMIKIIPTVNFLP